MRICDIVTPMSVMSYDELVDADRKLVDAARDATLNAYAPYSHFSVRAAVGLDDGAVVCGSNQENAAFPSGMCAERVAAFYAGANNPGAKFAAIAIAARDAEGKEVEAPVSPCGACRQVLLEYEKLAGRNVRVLLVGSDEIYVLPSVKSLLPLAFNEF